MTRPGQRPQDPPGPRARALVRCLALCLALGWGSLTAGSAHAAETAAPARTASAQGLRSQSVPGSAPPAITGPTAVSASATGMAVPEDDALGLGNLGWLALSAVGALLLIGSRSRH